ncbi:hypothetical protein J8273_4650 [Carpediemonas membranifera]|uniref:Uncharacterized protein n=1 Tax=Carpediemonas membranifera TaxID=201153 RepID=A0A8J6E3Y6_9EUKA|nr:hypothetical protein J8273_4650 [Carpediemonas membranifera]|eukprot:KAG9393787.1 hypothetical protein J8273_4650 [Carpediemonas membranifera]
MDETDAKSSALYIAELEEKIETMERLFERERELLSQQVVEAENFGRITPVKQDEGVLEQLKTEIEQHKAQHHEDCDKMKSMERLFEQEKQLLTQQIEEAETFCRNATTQQAEETIEHLRSEIEQHKAQHREDCDKIESMERLFEQEKQLLTQQIEEAETFCRNATTQQAEETIEHLRSEIEQHKAQHREDCDKIESMERLFEHEKQLLTQQVVEAEKFCRNTPVKQVEGTIEQLRADIERHKNQHREDREKMAELHKLHAADIARLQAESTERGQDLVRVRHELLAVREAAASRMTELGSKLHGVSASYTQLSFLASPRVSPSNTEDRSVSPARLAAIQRERDNAAATVMDLDATNKRLDRSLAEIQRELGSQTAALDTARAESAAARERVAELEQTLQQKETLVAELRERIQQLEAEREPNTRAGAMESELRTARRLNETLNAKIKRLEARVE